MSSFTTATTTNNNNSPLNARNVACFLLAFLVTTAPASAFTTSPSVTRPTTSLMARNNDLMIDSLMRIEWVQDQVRQLQDLEATVKAPPSKKPSVVAAVDRVSLQMDHDFADAISEPRIDPADLQRKLRERLQKAQEQKQAAAAVPIHQTSLQMDYDLADAISEPRVDPADLQRKLRARLAAAKQLKANKQQSMISSSQNNKRTVQVVP